MANFKYKVACLGTDNGNGIEKTQRSLDAISTLFWKHISNRPLHDRLAYTIFEESSGPVLK